MSNTSRVRGRQRELAVLKLLIGEGWVAFRVDGSADLVAFKAGRVPRLVQVKSTLTPWSHFGPEYRERLSADALKAGAVGELCWWPKGRGSPVWLPESSWP